MNERAIYVRERVGLQSVLTHATNKQNNYINYQQSWNTKS